MGNKKHLGQTGLIVALATVLFAFEWKTSNAELSDFAIVSEYPPEIHVMPITEMDPLSPPPPASKLADLLNIVENDTVCSIEDDIFALVEVMPQFPEGNASKWIARNIKYPPSALKNKIQGKVFIKFVIEKDGSITDIQVVRGVDASLDKEAVRVIKAMPKWKPGKQKGKAVRVSYTLPISFYLK